MIDTLGLEMEMPVAGRQDGRSRPATGFFTPLAARKAARGLTCEIKVLRGIDVGVAAPGIYSSIDNAFNNLESSIGPVRMADGGLERLAAIADGELTDALHCLAGADLTVLNVAEHPDVAVNPAFYAEMCAPKPIYGYWIGHRGWNHIAGADAKAHNSPSTGAGIDAAVDCLNMMLALAPATIALFANSPLEAGRITGLKENRLTLFPRMFASSHFPCDRVLATLPERPFRDLADYLRWMYGPGTSMQAVPIAGGGDYKMEGDLGIVEGDPALLSFLEGGPRAARSVLSGSTLTVAPTLGHLQYLQYSQFLDARIRWSFASMPPPEALIEALARPGGVEALFADHARDVYIEGRAAGTNFADAELADEAGDDVAASVVMAPGALQLGLMRNRDEALEIVRKWGWQTLRRMREEAIAHAMDATVDGRSMKDLCAEVLAAAERGLEPHERRFLAYAAHVAHTGRTGADRLLEAWNAAPADPAARLRHVAARRAAVAPRPARDPRYDPTSIADARSGQTAPASARAAQ